MVYKLYLNKAVTKKEKKKFPQNQVPLSQSTDHIIPEVLNSVLGMGQKQLRA